MRISAGNLFFFALALSACGEASVNQNNSRPIVMGNPATIVTETDSQYLRDAMPDFAPVAPMPKAVPAAAPPTDTTTAVAPPAQNAPAALPAGSGLTVDFGDLTVIVPGLQVQGATKNVKGQTAVAYGSLKADATGIKNVLLSGSLKVESVQQKNDYSLLWTAAGKTLVLGKAGTETTGWQALAGTGGNYKTTSFNPPTFKATTATLRAAAADAVKRSRLPRSETATLNSAAGKLRLVDGKDVKPALRTVVWKIMGKDGKGRSASHEVRVDMPL